MQGGIHPDYTLEHYGRWLRARQGGRARASTCTPTRRWRSTTCASARGALPRRSSSTCASAGSGSTPGTAAEVLDDGVRTRISPEQAARRRAGWRSSRPAIASGLRSTSTVMFGHIEEPCELARHMRVIRELQERTGGITEFVPLSFIPFQTLLGRTHGIEEISRGGEPQAHGRLPARARPDDPQPAGELGEDGARGGHREPALGGQRPRRDADGGEHLADGRARSTGSDSTPRT